MNITINDDLTAVIVDDRGWLCRLSQTNPKTLKLFSSKEEISQFIQREVTPNAARYFSAPPSPESVAESKRIQIENERDATLVDPDAQVTVSDIVFQADPKSISQLNDTLTTFMALGGAPAGYEWRDANNVNHPADLPFLASIAAARAEQVNQIWRTSWDRKAVLDAIDLNAADAITQIEAV